MNMLVVMQLLLSAEMTPHKPSAVQQPGSVKKPITSAVGQVLSVDGVTVHGLGISTLVLRMPQALSTQQVTPQVIPAIGDAGGHIVPPQEVSATTVVSQVSIGIPVGSGPEPPVPVLIAASMPESTTAAGGPLSWLLFMLPPESSPQAPSANSPANAMNPRHP